jgi:hypothetical protein
LVFVLFGGGGGAGGEEEGIVVPLHSTAAHPTVATGHRCLPAARTA